jgi:hypothetical protein
MQRSMVLAAMVLTAACGGGSGSITGVAPLEDVVQGSGIYDVSGTVSEEVQSGEQPSFGARVVFDGPGASQQTRSDVNGNFSVPGLAAGHWNVTVSKAGYEPQSMGIRVAGNLSLAFRLEYDSDRRGRYPR